MGPLVSREKKTIDMIWRKGRVHAPLKPSAKDTELSDHKPVIQILCFNV